MRYSFQWSFGPSVLMKSFVRHEACGYIIRLHNRVLHRLSYSVPACINMLRPPMEFWVLRERHSPLIIRPNEGWIWLDMAEFYQ